MKKFLQKRFIDALDESSDVNEFFRGIISEIEEWPEIGRENIYSDDYDDESNQEEFSEPVGIDDLSILELKDDYVLICAGGDWQEPQQIKITLHNGSPVAEIIDEGWDNGINDAEFLKELFDIESESVDFEEIVETIKNNNK